VSAPVAGRVLVGCKAFRFRVIQVDPVGFNERRRTNISHVCRNSMRRVKGNWRYHCEAIFRRKAKNLAGSIDISNTSPRPPDA
jgi:hypothetical protein